MNVTKVTQSESGENPQLRLQTQAEFPVKELTPQPFPFIFSPTPGLISLFAFSAHFEG